MIIVLYSYGINSSRRNYASVNVVILVMIVSICVYNNDNSLILVLSIVVDIINANQL